MNALSEYIERMIGPFLFVIGMALFLALYQHEIRYVQDVQEVYVSDDVYAQHYDKKKYTDKATRDDIVASLINGVTCDVSISWRQNSIYAGPGACSSIHIRNMTGDRFQIDVYKQSIANAEELVDSRIITSFQGYQLGDRTIDTIIPKEYTIENDEGYMESWSYVPVYDFDRNGNVTAIRYEFKKE